MDERTRHLMSTGKHTHPYMDLKHILNYSKLPRATPLVNKFRILPEPKPEDLDTYA